MTDRELIEASRRGDHAAFGHLVERYQRMVEAVAYSRTHDRALVDDAVQDTFVAAWRQLDRLQDPERLRPWLCGIARNLACKALRRRRREQPLPDLAAGTTPFEVATETEREQLVAAALAQLSPRYREPLVLFYYEQCSVKDVAATLSIREDAAMQRLSRGRQQLGEVLADRIEHTLEHKRSRKALVAGVLALLVPGHEASAAPGAAVSTPFGWRLAAGVMATILGVVIVTLAADRSEQVARAQAARQETAIAAAPVPVLPESPAPLATADEEVHRTIVVAGPDPTDGCTRAARGLVYWLFAQDVWQTIDGQQYFRPSPAVERDADTIGAKVGASCEGAEWSAQYVECEGTITELLDGNLTCYPYDILDA